MKKINLENTLCIYDEGELDAVYEVKKTKSDIAKALDDCGCFADIDEDDWDVGIGDDGDCHSLNDIAAKILEDGSFFDEESDRFFGIDGNCPCR